MLLTAWGGRSHETVVSSLLLILLLSCPQAILPLGCLAPRLSCLLMLLLLSCPQARSGAGLCSE